jgi:hypothetical protein
MSKLSPKSKGRLWIATGSLIGVTVTAFSCGKSASQTTSASEDNENAIVYTFMSRSAFEGRSPQSEGAAAYKSGFREFAYRTTGLLLPKQTAGDQSIFVDIEASELELLRTCSGDTCNIALRKIEGTKGTQTDEGDPDLCPAVTVPAKQSEFVLDCPSFGIAHFAFRRSLPILASIPLRRPHTAFELFRLGPIYRGDAQVAAFVHKDAPIVFAVEPVAIEKGLLPDLQLAADYWNRAIGYTAIRIDPKAAIGGPQFSPLRSAIRYREEVSGIAASASNYADPVTGQILAMRLDIRTAAMSMSKEELRTTLAHEMGHALGLAHNFAASSDPLTIDSPAGSSVMDYYDSADMPKDLGSTLMYDQAAVDWIYRGKRPDKNYRHCSDVQSWYLLGCDKLDARVGPDKKLIDKADSLKVMLASDALLLKKFLDPVVADGAWSEVVKLKAGGDLSWAEKFLSDPVTAGSFVSAAYKYSVFSPDPQTRAAVKRAWTELFEAALRAPADIYPPAQLEFLKLSLEMFQTEPVTPASLKTVLERLKASGP